MMASYRGPYQSPTRSYPIPPGRRILAEGGKFVVELWSAGLSGMLRPEYGHSAWIIPLSGSGTLDGHIFGPGAVWLCDAEVPIHMRPGSELLVAYAGASVRQDLIRPGDIWF